MAIKLSKDTTMWLDVSVTSAKLKKAKAAYDAALSAMLIARKAMEAIKTAELVAAGEIEAGFAPIYGYAFGKWTVAAEKNTLGNPLIVQATGTAKATARRSV